LLEAINQVGGLNEFVTEIYVFRYEEPLTPARDWNLAPVPLNAPSGDAGARLESHTSSAKQELLDAVAPEPIGKAETGARLESRTSMKDDIPESLEPDPTQPYIYVNKEFVPNPIYVGAHGGTATAPPEIPPFDTAAPAVNWSRIAGDTSYRVLLIAAEALRSGDPEANIFIRAGDVIRISSGEVGVYYVMGQVGRVGTFRFEAEQITLKAAIAAAGGLSNLAWPDRCTVYRRLGQREQMIQVNLDRIFAGLDTDFTIKRGDIINVGTHPFAPFLERIRALTLPNPVNNVGYSFTYARNFADVDSFSVKQNPADKPKTFPNLFSQ
jgi:hypothetical protein